MEPSEPVIIASARRHEVADEDMLHAVRNPVRTYEQDEGLTLFIGPDRAARMLEVGVVDSEAGPVIVHAMAARRRFLR